MNEAMRDKVVVVAGASAGIGRAIALAFAAQGARVGVLARDEGRLQSLCEEIRALGSQAHPVVVDVALADTVEQAADEVERVLGPIDVWVNNAMVTIFAKVDDIRPDEFRRVTEVSYLGTVYGTMAALRRMRSRERGSIIQIGSALAYRSIPLQSAYCGAKAAIRGFTDSLRAELIHEKSSIRLSMVQLSGFNTPQFDWARNRMGKRPQPVGAVFEPEVAAQAVVRAAKDGPREVWVGWSAVQSILANRVAPGLADRLVASQAFDQQHTDEPDPPGRSDNLFDTVDWDERVHGRFSAKAKATSTQQWMSEHPAVVVLGAAAVAAGVGYALARKH
jgi:NAD(P)-dependent dehydrogenase (short-subunit alcohol dehydrogenase family)